MMIGVYNMYRYLAGLPLKWINFCRAFFFGGPLLTKVEMSLVLDLGCLSVWSNYSDLTRPHPNGGLVIKGNPLMSGKSFWWIIMIWPDPCLSHDFNTLAQLLNMSTLPGHQLSPLMGGIWYFLWVSPDTFLVVGKSLGNLHSDSVSAGWCQWQ